MKDLRKAEVMLGIDIKRNRSQRKVFISYVKYRGAIGLFMYLMIGSITELL